jgi:hypothetical protein
MQARSLDGHETDLFGIIRLRQVIDRHAGRPVARGGLRLGVMIDRALVVGLLIAELRLGEHVLVVDDQQKIVVRLKVKCPGVGRRRDVLHVFGMGGIADVYDGEALGEDVTDISVATMHHDLDAVAPPTLIAVPDEAHIFGCIVGFGKRRLGHRRSPCRTSFEELSRVPPYAGREIANL